ncbi:5-dehydro-2-deoxygluconokinase [Sedimentisphaera cyanobacteriorum]|uniref:5-dehydro-2-deoxygluconokinase n=1 Tax=Sedimentisphaera cyanobacteriorum TaxID=1940790 RepID=A0A1Q2HN57_9BACT|nr:sugar kinase [Sedimentisphaera cyanobacteriorum]AQQ08646.1 5-dehydro-2-deoxygluconokinase [Sedimentisphaera cyanobacteriorum]
MSDINLRPESECKYDILSLGEIMLRLDPGENRIHTTRQFNVWEGGGEYNVARGLKRCFGKRAAVAAAIVDNPVGRLLEDLLYQGGVSQEYVKWVPFDGIGRKSRVGLNFTERGFGLRAARGCSDRGCSAASQIKKGDINWDSIFGIDGIRWFHSGGIFAGLSETTPEALIEAMQTAKKYGTIVSYDLNYRASLWKDIGGKEKAMEVNREIAPLVDVMIGNEEDFSASLGFEVQGLDENCSRLDPANFKKMIREAVSEFPNFKAVATTLRNAVTASKNDWGAVLYSGGKFYDAQLREKLEILDRVGGGDSFASGLIYALMEGKDPQTAVNYGAAHGALAMTTPGDTTTADLKEVERLVEGGSARIAR